MRSYCRASSFHYNPKTGVCYRKLDFLVSVGYRIGDDGSLWSKRRRKGAGKKHGSVSFIGGKWKRLVLLYRPKGYAFISLRLANREYDQFSVHRLVLSAFVGPCPSNMEGCHWDGNPRNNRLENLRWDTRKNNHADKRRHGTSLLGKKQPKNEGEGNPSAKLTNNQVGEIRKLYESGGHSQGELGRRYNIAQVHIGKIVNYQAWKDGREHTVKKNKWCKKLTKEQVQQIRNLYVPYKFTMKQLATQFGVTTASIWGIINGSNWTS